jgi:RNA 2',3'-cyclic 3'-phosphodiesterase
VSPEATPTERLFFALWPPTDLIEGLVGIRDTAWEQVGGRSMDAASLHCTLAFLGALDREQMQAAIKAAAGVRGEPFELEFSRLNYWPQNRIVWAGLSLPSPGLQGLADSLRLALSGIVGLPEFDTPHITLIRGASRAPDLNYLEVPLWHCSEFVLARSLKNASGARYELIARWPLAGGGE